MRYDKKYLDRAIELAVSNVERGQGGPFGAVIVTKELEVFEGVNQVTLTNDPTAHAEVVAIRKACSSLESFRLTECSLYASCEPCPMCLAALYWARIGALYFAATKEDAARGGFDDAFFYEEMARPIDQRHLLTKQMGHEQASKPFALWCASSERVDY